MPPTVPDCPPWQSASSRLVVPARREGAGGRDPALGGRQLGGGGLEHVAAVDAAHEVGLQQPGRAEPRRHAVDRLKHPGHQITAFLDDFENVRRRAAALGRTLARVAARRR